MKKITSVILMLMLLLSLSACGGDGGSAESSGDAGSSSAQTSEASTDSETVGSESETTAVSDTIQSGDSGTGPASLDAGLIKLDIPEGMGYTVGSFYISESDSLSGNVTIQIRDERGRIAAKLEATTMNMVSSREEAVENVISLRNLDSYKEGKSSVEGDTEYGENTYSLVKISTENYKRDYFVAYVGDRYANDKNGLLISLEVDLDEISSDDQTIKDILSSVTVVKG